LDRAYRKSGRAECILNYGQKRWNERMIVNLGVVGRIRKRILKKQMEECGLD
jgi:hypothetical protein